MKIKRLKRLLVFLIAITIACIAKPVFAVEKQLSDQKVAVVNSVVITQEAFDRELMRVFQQLAAAGRSFSEAQLPDIKKGVVDVLVNRELIYQESQNQGLKVADSAVNDQFDILKKRFAGEDEFKAALLNMKTSEPEIKSQLRKSIAVQQFVDNKFVQKIEVPEKQVKAFYNSHPDSFKEPEQVRARHIIINVGPGADESKKSAAIQKLKEVQKRLGQGEDFEMLAKAYSDGPSAAKGGDLGYFGKGQMVKSFEEAAFGLPPGKVSDIVETEFGYHLIKVVDKKPESTIGYEQAKDNVQNYLKQRKVQEEVNLYIEKLKGKAKVEIFLEEKS